ncbi:RDD family protein [Actinoplanes subtropicus]|uniref:RDD family protein n=1 Tax=Actinoplanes subtropicus TaxID=543632 RepID=UPI0005586E4F|nr:RDD family protein [Actinoplanes subtropicus]
MRPLPVSPAGVPLADFGTRLAAYLIDGVILGFGSMIVLVPAVLVAAHWWLPGHGVEDNASGEVFFRDFLLPFLLFEAGFFVFILLVYYGYFVEYMHRKGETLGKKIMKIRVVPIDPSARLTRGMAAKRYLVQFIAGTFVPFFNYLDGLWQLWDKPYLQTLHDKAAHTVVVKVSA